MQIRTKTHVSHHIYTLKHVNFMNCLKACTHGPSQLKQKMLKIGVDTCTKKCFNTSVHVQMSTNKLQNRQNLWGGGGGGEVGICTETTEPSKLVGGGGGGEVGICTETTEPSKLVGGGGGGGGEVGICTETTEPSKLVGGGGGGGGGEVGICTETTEPSKLVGGGGGGRGGGHLH